MKVLLIILLILFLIGQVRVGVRLELKENIFSLWARLGAIKLQILPAKKKPDRPPKEKKPKKAKKPKKPKEGGEPAPARETGKGEAAPTDSKAEPPVPPEKGADKPASTLGDKVELGLDYAGSFLPIALDLGRHFFKKLRIDTLHMILTVGDPDPADAAMLYGRANGALGALWEPLTEVFRVEDGYARVDLDFDNQKTDFYIRAALSLKIGQIIWIALYFGLRALRAFLSVRSRQKKKAETRKAA